MSFDVNWDIDKYKEDHESNEQWLLRRNFMKRWKTNYPEERLVCLARVFANIEFMGCRYPQEVMQEVAAMSKEVNENVTYNNNASFDAGRSLAQDSANAESTTINPTAPLQVSVGKNKQDNYTNIYFVRSSERNSTVKRDYLWRDYSTNVTHGLVSINKVLQTIDSKSYCKNLPNHLPGNLSWRQLLRTDSQQAYTSDFTDNTYSQGKEYFSSNTASASWHCIEPEIANCYQDYVNNTEIPQPDGIQSVNWQTNQEILPDNHAKLPTVEDTLISAHDANTQLGNPTELSKTQVITNDDGNPHDVDIHFRIGVPQDPNMSNNDGKSTQELNTKLSQLDSSSDLASCSGDNVLIGKKQTVNPLEQNLEVSSVVIDHNTCQNTGDTRKKKKPMVKKQKVSGPGKKRRYKYWLHVGKTEEEARALCQTKLSKVPEYKHIKATMGSSRHYCKSYYKYVTEHWPNGKVPKNSFSEFQKIYKPKKKSTEIKKNFTKMTSARNIKAALRSATPASNTGTMFNKLANKDHFKQIIKARTPPKIIINDLQSKRDEINDDPDIVEFCVEEPDLMETSDEEENSSSSTDAFRRNAEIRIAKEVQENRRIWWLQHGKTEEEAAILCQTEMLISDALEKIPEHKEIMDQERQDRASIIATYQTSNLIIPELESHGSYTEADNTSEFRLGENTIKSNQPTIATLQPHTSMTIPEPCGNSGMLKSGKKAAINAGRFQIFVKDVNKEMCKKDIMALRNAITHSIIDNDEIRFLSLNKKHGFAVLTCGDVQTRDWFDKEIPALKPWNGAQLEIIDEIEIPKYDYAWIYCPIIPECGPLLKPAAYLSKLHKQNPGVGCDKWIVLHAQMKEEGQLLFVRFKEKSTKILESMNYKLNWYSSPVKVKLKKKKVPKPINTLNQKILEKSSKQKNKKLRKNPRSYEELINNLRNQTTNKSAPLITISDHECIRIQQEKDDKITYTNTPTHNMPMTLGSSIINERTIIPNESSYSEMSQTKSYAYPKQIIPSQHSPSLNLGNPVSSHSPILMNEQIASEIDADILHPKDLTEASPSLDLVLQPNQVTPLAMSLGNSVSSHSPLLSNEQTASEIDAELSHPKDLTKVSPSLESVLQSNQTTPLAMSQGNSVSSQLVSSHSPFLTNEQIAFDVDIDTTNPKDLTEASPLLRNEQIASDCTEAFPSIELVSQSNQATPLAESQRNPISSQLEDASQQDITEKISVKIPKKKTSTEVYTKIDMTVFWGIDTPCLIPAHREAITVKTDLRECEFFDTKRKVEYWNRRGNDGNAGHKDYYREGKFTGLDEEYSIEERVFAARKQGFSRAVRVSDEREKTRSQDRDFTKRDKGNTQGVATERDTEYTWKDGVRDHSRQERDYHRDSRKEREYDRFTRKRRNSNEQDEEYAWKSRDFDGEQYSREERGLTVFDDQNYSRTGRVSVTRNQDFEKPERKRSRGVDRRDQEFNQYLRDGRDRYQTRDRSPNQFRTVIEDTRREADSNSRFERSGERIVFWNQDPKKGNTSDRTTRSQPSRWGEYRQP